MAFYLRWKKKKAMSFNSPLCKDAPKQGPIDKMSLSLIYRTKGVVKHDTLCTPNKSQCHFCIKLGDKLSALNATNSLETKYRCVVKRYWVYGKTPYRPPNETLYTLAVRPVLGRGLTMNNSFVVLRLR